ncbi:hypothetical protein NDU88_004624 [Pleurodeles waltl]|uniref:Uncharacterized protein n=1 Tax=Pleurodeles waltl TaxID=8319 RepID=A0AAV7WSF2_PLEWA|nr:hypothetical protein NDU88_004624 [Pleurodeles waltl]
MRTVEDVETVLSGHSMPVPTYEQTHKKLCATPKNKQSAMDNSMGESEPMALSLRRKEHKVLLHSCSNRDLVVPSDHLGDGKQKGKSDYLNESSLMFLNYTLPVVPCSPVVNRNKASARKIGSCEQPDALLTSDVGSEAWMEAALVSSSVNNRATSSRGLCLDGSIFQGISVSQHLRANPISAESPQGFIISEAMTALNHILALILALLEKFLGGTNHIETLLTIILQALVPGGRTDERNQDIPPHLLRKDGHSCTKSPVIKRNTVQRQTPDFNPALTEILIQFDTITVNPCSDGDYGCGVGDGASTVVRDTRCTEEHQASCPENATVITRSKQPLTDTLKPEVRTRGLQGKAPDKVGEEPSMGTKKKGKAAKRGKGLHCLRSIP